jgi:hypothetical protein
MRLVKTLDEIKGMFDERSRFDFGCICDGVVTYSCWKGGVWYELNFVPIMNDFHFVPQPHEQNMSLTLINPMPFNHLIEQVDPNGYLALNIVNQDKNTPKSPNDIWEEYLYQLDNPVDFKDNNI